MLQQLENCRLCPRNCGINRLSGERGYCGAGALVKVGRAALHFWEEPCLSGKSGSGTVFFSYCTLQCVYCQNISISREKVGKEISIERLASIFLELQEQGANNINLVTPTHYIPQIITALDLAKSEGLSLPIVYNTSGYETVEALQLLRGYIDIYLPDFKYDSAMPARRYSNAADYPEAVRLALDEMVRQTGKPVFDQNGIMKRGTIVRHLVLPGYGMESKRILHYLYERYGNLIYISLMNQYTPFANVIHYPEINRRISPSEYHELVRYAVEIGIENAFVQEEGAAEESFIPLFDGEGV